MGPAPEPWVSDEAVAEHLGVTNDSIYRWIERRGFPTHRIERLWRLQLSEVVDAWVQAAGSAVADIADVERER